MRQTRMLEARATLVTTALVACCCLPALVHAQTGTGRTIVVKEPTGWFGVRISDRAMVDEGGNAFFDSYPTITHVDSNSPAAKAGVQVGDVLLTFNSHDMRGGSIDLAEWLKADAPFTLKIRRNDAIRVLKGRLVKRPPDWDQRVVFELTVPERLELRGGSLSRGPIERTMQVRSRVPTPEPLPTVLTPALGFGGGVYPFAGADFTRLNSDLSDVLGVKAEGVFVTNVQDGSLARTAGLRGGDIVLRADNVKIKGPVDLVRVIGAADARDRSIDLQIMRKHQLQSLTLRW